MCSKETIFTSKSGCRFSTDKEEEQKGWTAVMKTVQHSGSLPQTLQQDLYQWKRAARHCPARRPRYNEALLCIITAERNRVARAMGVGEKEKECTTACKSQRRLDAMPPCVLDYGNGNGEGGGDENGRRKGGEERASRL